MEKRLMIFGAAALMASSAAASEFRIDRSVMSDAYWKIWNDAEQSKIDADIERNRKADCEVKIGDDGEAAVPVGTEVTVEQLAHDFRFGAHIFNFDQLGKDASERRFGGASLKFKGFSLRQ